MRGYYNSAHNLISSCENTESLKNSGLNRVRIHDLCNTGEVLDQLSYQANWELATCEGEEYQ